MKFDSFTEAALYEQVAIDALTYWKNKIGDEHYIQRKIEQYQELVDQLSMEVDLYHE